MDNIKICCLCNRKYIGYGNNALPLKDGRCCDECNSKVIDERIRQIILSQEVNGNKCVGGVLIKL